MSKPEMFEITEGFVADALAKAAQPKEKRKKDPSYLRLNDSIPKPVMSESVEEDVLDLLTQYQEKDKWRMWGMHKLRAQGSSVLLRGPTGTGKTSIARYIAHKLGKGCKILDVSFIGGGDPGQSEKGVREFVTDARKRGNATIFMDECDNLLGNRATISDDTWKLGTIETIMMEMNIYPGLWICATNHPEKLDPALASRFMCIVDVGEPDYGMRIKLWKGKWPKEFPLQPTPEEIKKLAKHPLNGRQIETVLVRVASSCIRKKEKPKMSMFHIFCESEKGKHIESEGE